MFFCCQRNRILCLKHRMYIRILLHHFHNFLFRVPILCMVSSQILTHLLIYYFVK